MTGISRCLLPFIKGLRPLDAEQVKERLAALPTTCPHSDCSPGTCEDHCRPYAEMQYRIARRLQRYRRAA